MRSRPVEVSSDAAWTGVERNETTSSRTKIRLNGRFLNFAIEITSQMMYGF